MRLLANLFGKKRTASDSNGASFTISATASNDLAQNGAKLAEIEEFIPPLAREVAYEVHAQAVISFFQARGQTGPIEHWRLYRYYPELAWMNGFVELPERQFLVAMGRLCRKTRMESQRSGVLSKVSAYVIPPPPVPGAKIVSMKQKGRVKPQIREADADAPWPEMPARAGVA